jgi:hypothetical protein
MPIRNSLQANQAYRTTNHNLINAIESALGQANSYKCRKLYIIATAIIKNFLLRNQSSLVKIAIFNYTLIQLIFYIDLDLFSYIVTLG